MQIQWHIARKSLIPFRRILLLLQPVFENLERKLVRPLYERKGIRFESGAEPAAVIVVRGFATIPL